MLTHQPNATHSQPHPFTPDLPLPDPSRFADFAEKLQQAARALLDLASEEPPTSPLATSDADTSQDECPQSVPHALRCYTVPVFILKEEEALLKTHGADGLPDLLEKVHEDLSLLAYLMRHFDEAEEVEGYTIQLLGERLQSSMALLGRICSVLADFEQTEQPEAA